MPLALPPLPPNLSSEAKSPRSCLESAANASTRKSIAASTQAIAKLNSQTIADTAERCRLHLPVVDRVRKQADAVIERPLHPKSSRAEVIHAHLLDVVGMEVHHLESRSGKGRG
ncbi:hypothetical protein EYF80_007483 [Liparis tanakae]|uniref:Uncharacterized protein n=1 Tax=Liparis tanakae TaxID=230148 RepID=A0A4Z2IYJ1_9TELE|nr:hypothetical protein EYF80_007483 [Liparis tanakae]